MTALENDRELAGVRYIVTRHVDGSGCNATVVAMTNNLEEARAKFLEAAGDRATSLAVLHDMSRALAGAAIAEYKRAVALW